MAIKFDLCTDPVQSLSDYDKNVIVKIMEGMGVPQPVTESLIYRNMHMLGSTDDEFKLDWKRVGTLIQFYFDTTGVDKGVWDLRREVLPLARINRVEAIRQLRLGTGINLRDAHALVNRNIGHLYDSMGNLLPDRVLELIRTVWKEELV